MLFPKDPDSREASDQNPGTAASSEAAETIDLIAADRVRRGDRDGFASIEEFADEFGVDPAITPDSTRQGQTELPSEMRS